MGILTGISNIQEIIHAFTSKKAEQNVMEVVVRKRKVNPLRGK